MKIQTLTKFAVALLVAGSMSFAEAKVKKHAKKAKAKTHHAQTHKPRSKGHQAASEYMKSSRKGKQKRNVASANSKKHKKAAAHKKKKSRKSRY